MNNDLYMLMILWWMWGILIIAEEISKKSMSLIFRKHLNFTLILLSWSLSTLFEYSFTAKIFIISSFAALHLYNEFTKRN